MPPESQHDFIVDCLAQWWESVRERFAHMEPISLIISALVAGVAKDEEIIKAAQDLLDKI